MATANSAANGRTSPALDKSYGGYHAEPCEERAAIQRRAKRHREALRLYRRHYARKHHTSEIPEQPLLFVPMHASRTLACIARKAGVELRTFKGKIDFHALRVAYINMLITSGADFKTVLELSRHTAAYMTALYARSEDDLIAKAVESIGERIISVKRDSNESIGFALRMVQ